MKPKREAKGAPVQCSITNCCIEQGKNVAGVSPETARAVEALAKAISDCAIALRGPSHTFGPAVNIGAK